jgi:Dehydrogenase E1 component/Transketolase, pyrimidine binding domain
MLKSDLINFEQHIADLYRDCKLPFLFHLSGGNEDQLLEIFQEIKEGDYVLSTHRNHYHALLHGIPPKELEEKILGGRSMFIYDRRRNFFTSAIIGGTVAIAAGIALALKKKNSSQKVWCFIGDGTEDTGHLFEAARYVEGFGLPCTFIIEDNNRSVTTPKPERWGKTITPDFFSCVRRYSYNIPWPHARTNDMIDLSKTKQLTDDEYFPGLSDEKLEIEMPTEEIAYKKAVPQAMTEIGKANSIFIGYNVKNGNAMGTLSGVSDSQKLETPVAENLMTGLAIGMSLEGFRPVVYFERHDFMLVAADAIVNHVNYIERISHGEYKVPVILRAVVADSGPFYSGLTHSQDFTNGFKALVDFPIYVPTTGKEVLIDYRRALKSTRPSMVVEKKSYYV